MMTNSSPAPTDTQAILDDWPATVDALGFEAYKSTLVDILCNEATRTPLTIGLFGDWGSGKTSLMTMVKADIEAAKPPAYHTAWFNAWKYHREKALWRALVLRVLDALRPRGLDGDSAEGLTESEEALVRDLDRMEESLYRTVEWDEVGRWTLDWMKALRGTTMGAAEIALAFVPGGTPMAHVLKQVAKTVTGDKKDQSLADALRRGVKTHRRERLRSLEQFEREFQALLERHVVRRSGRLIIFVDDLDRCVPNNMIEILEAIKLFLDVPGCAFVLGLDQEAIVEAIQTRYQGKVKGRQYLEKMIQLPFQLPPIEAEAMRGFVESIASNLPDERCSMVFAQGLPHNPRKVKRTVNIFLMLWKLSRRKLPGVIQPVRLAKLVTIQHSYPDLYALLREMPHLLRDLEEYFRSRLMSADGDVIRPSGESRRRPLAISLPTPLEPFVERRILHGLLTMHNEDEPGANFIDQNPGDIRSYIYLTRQAESRPATPMSTPVPQTVKVRAGPFTLGGEEYNIERPPHEVHLLDYEIGRYPVTNYEYKAFVTSAKDINPRPPWHWEGSEYPEETGDHPVVNVSWHDAISYCRWLSRTTGRPFHLPTEAEWEKAARGDSGRTWAWGNRWDEKKCNTRGNGPGRTTPVGQYSPDGDSPYAASDMIGNVWEWCSSLSKPYPYDPGDGREDLQETGERVSRGGSFSSETKLAHCAYRYKRLSNSRDRTLGFRVVLRSGDATSSSGKHEPSPAG